MLEQIGVRFEVRVPHVDETRAATEAPGDYVRRLAGAKAETIWDAAGGASPVLGADTAVVVGESILGKPSEPQEALEMLAILSGRSHRVFTAVMLRTRYGLDGLVNVSEVRFRSTTEAERRAYCATGEPLDKAGAYGIQGLGAVFVEHLSGSYSGVMGLPLCETALLLERSGVSGWWSGGTART